MVKATTRLGQSSVIYRALDHIKSQQIDNTEGGQCTLDEAQIRIVTAQLTGMKLSGVGLEGDDKEQFNKNKVRLSELCTTRLFVVPHPNLKLSPPLDFLPFLS